MRGGRRDQSAGGSLISRRAVLAGLAATPALAVVTGCTSGSSGRVGNTASGNATSTPKPDPDAPIRDRAVTASQSLVTAYEAALGVPTLVTLVTPMLADHRAHLEALGAAAPEPSVSTGTASASASASATVAPTTPEPAATIAGLIGAERTSSADRAADALSATNGSLARLLASIAACQGVHVVLLQDGGA